MQNELIQKYIDHNFFGKLLGMDFTIISKGNVEYRIKVNKDHLATPNAAHGGLISSLVDAALGVAGLSVVSEDNKVVSTVEYKINFLSPAFLNDELVAHAKTEQVGKRIVIASCDVVCTNRQNKPIAKAMGTFNAYDAAKTGY